MAHPRGRARQSRGARLSTRWLASAGLSIGGLSAGNQALNAVVASEPKATIMRTRGEVLVYVDSTQAPAGLALVSMGLILVPEGTGTTVLWDPFADANAPWFWYQETFLGYEEAVTDVIANQQIMAHRIVVDSKAMRIANGDEEVQFVVTNTTINGARVINAAAAFRFLIGE